MRTYLKGLYGAAVLAAAASLAMPMAAPAEAQCVDCKRAPITKTNTVYKYVPDEANAAAAAAVALFNGKKPKTNATRPNGSKKQPTLVIPVVSITKANYTRLFKDKFLKRSDVCSGQYKKYCK